MDFNQKQITSLARAILTSASITALIVGGVSAQETDTSEDDAAELDTVIVIGTAGGQGIDQQDASFVVTNLESDEITRFAPKSTADLLKAIPGVWVESSGGVSGANIDVRGFPGGSNAPFVTFTINGSPVYGFQSLSFLEGSTLFRVDETIRSVEGLQGGPGTVFGIGEPGLTANFNLKEGGEGSEGLAKLTVTDFGERRFDGVISGKVADDLYYMLGGYIRAGEGIRDPQFTGEEGYQLTANITKEFDNGKVNLFARTTDDTGQWILPFNTPAAGDDRGTFTQLGNATRFREIQVGTNGDTEVFDFARGRGWDGTVFGGSADFKLADWTVTDRFSYTTGRADTLGLVPAGSAVLASDVETIIGSPVLTSGQTPSGTSVVLDGSEFVQTFGHWVVEKDLKTFTNDLTLSREFSAAGEHDLAFGYFLAQTSADDWWSLGNPIALHNTQNGDTLANATPADVAAAGGDAGFTFGLAQSGDARVDAIYAHDSWQIAGTPLRFDGGVRYEWYDVDHIVDSGPGFPDGTTDQVFDVSDEEVAYTLALNYELSDQLGLYARWTDSFRWPDFDTLRSGNGTIGDIKEAQVGVKLSTDHFDVFANLFRNEIDQASNTVGSVTASSNQETRTLGVEVDAQARFGPLSGRVIGVYQDSEITNSTNPAFIGNQVLRQPEWYVRANGEYTYEGDSFDGVLYASMQYIGEDRFSDNANLQPLDAYEKIDLGAQLNLDSGLFFQVHVDNVTDSDGETEGDPRALLAVNERTIFGRSVKFSVGYGF